MNLHKLTRYVLLLWLPLASLKPRDKSELYHRLSRQTSLPNRPLSLDDEEEGLVERLPEKVEEDPAEGRSGADAGRRLSAGGFPETISANSGGGTGERPPGGGKASTAQEPVGSPTKDSSALNVNSSVGSKSAAAFRRRLRRKRKVPGRRARGRRETLMKISLDEDPNAFEDYDEEEEAEEAGDRNSTEMGSYLGAPCELTCSEKLIHVFCDPRNRVCECEEKYPVQIGVGRGCEKPKQLGDQCFYAQTCSFSDPNAVCTQINHNAICQCKPGFHTVALRKGVKRMFCSEDIAVVSADLPTLLGVATGIAVLTGLICFVLRLFSGNRYPHTRHYANANIAPPLLLSSDNQWINGIPLTVHGRPPSRASCQRSTVSLAQYSRSKGVLVPASRAGSRRHSFSSAQSTTSSQRSMTYSARRFEQENQQKEQRAAMRAAREEAVRLTTPLTPSPMSTDGLIPPSKHLEEEPLSFQEEDPPALSMAKANVPPPPSSPK